MNEHEFISPTLKGKEITEGDVLFYISPYSAESTEIKVADISFLWLTTMSSGCNISLRKKKYLIESTSGVIYELESLSWISLDEDIKNLANVLG